MKNLKSMCTEEMAQVWQKPEHSCVFQCQAVWLLEPKICHSLGRGWGASHPGAWEPGDPVGGGPGETGLGQLSRGEAVGDLTAVCQRIREQ